MKINTVTIENYKPFHGEIKVGLSPDGERNTILLRGKNDRGKTAFLNAIRFCLYGSSRAELKKAVNRRAAMEGAGSTSVELEFFHNNKKYRAKRSVDFNQADNPSAIYVENEQTQINKHIQNEWEPAIAPEDPDADYEIFIQNVLPKKASDFFLFDGEQIDEYAKSLSSDDEKISKAVETVLGIRKLRQVRDNVQTYGVQHYNRRYSQAQSESERYREKKDELEEARDNFERLKDNQEKLEQEIRQREIQRQQERRRLNVARDAEELFLQELRAKIKLKGSDEFDLSDWPEIRREQGDEQGIENKLEQVRQDLQSIYANIAPSVAIIGARNISSILKPYNEGFASVIRSTLEADDNLCKVCGQEYDEERAETIREKLYQVSRETNEYGTILDQSSDELIQKFQQYDDDIGPNPTEIRYDQKVEQIRSLSKERKDLEDRIEHLNQEQKNLDTDHSAAIEIQEHIDSLTEEIEEHKERLGKLESKIEQAKEVIDDKEEELGSLEGASKKEERYNRLQDFSERVEQAVSELTNRYLQTQRSSVQQKMSDLFLTMTNKPGVYNGLVLDSDFQLKLQAEDRTFTIQNYGSSRGARQIIAYSFIAGLAKYSSHHAPLVIDTPIARLDKEHKKQLLSTLPELASQVIVLYQPNELAGEDIKRLDTKGAVSEHYEIKIGPYNNTSVIEPYEKQS